MSRPQWSIIWITAILLVLAWPPAAGRSLGAKALNWLVDPTGALPRLPEALPMGMDDNGDAVAEHDARLSEYYRLYESSSLTRARMELKTAADPLDPSTTRQLLVGLGIVAALSVWGLNTRNH